MSLYQYNFVSKIREKVSLNSDSEEIIEPYVTISTVDGNETIDYKNKKIFTFKQGLDRVALKINIFMRQYLGSLFYDRTIGNNFDDYIFENATNDELSRIKEEIKNTLITMLSNDVKDIIVTDVELVYNNNKREYDVTVSVLYNNTEYSVTISGKAP